MISYWFIQLNILNSLPPDKKFCWRGIQNCAGFVFTSSLKLWKNTFPLLPTSQHQKVHLTNKNNECFLSFDVSDQTNEKLKLFWVIFDPKYYLQVFFQLESEMLARGRIPESPTLSSCGFCLLSALVVLLIKTRQDN